MLVILLVYIYLLSAADKVQIYICEFVCLMSL